MLQRRALMISSERTRNDYMRRGHTMNIGNQKRRSKSFEIVFNALGSETRGISPIAACVILVAFC